MATKATKPNLFRRLNDTVGLGGILTPHIERELLLRGEDVWPEEYAIKVYNKERRWDGYFHPSSHAALSGRELFYLFHPDPEVRVKQPPPSVELIMTFQVGSAYHSLLQSMLIHLGFTTEEDCEVSFVNKERHCSGTIDVKQVTLPDGSKHLLEIKSAGYLPKSPPDYYVKQVQVYMDAAFETPQQTGILLFLEKSAPHRFKEFLIERDERILDEVYSKWNTVLEALEFNDPSMLECCRKAKCLVADRCGVIRNPFQT